jgi:hypothetical protein
MKTTIYTMVIEDNVPHIKPLDNVGSATINGINYWLVPVVMTQDKPAPDEGLKLKPFTPHRVALREQVLALGRNEPNLSLSEIARRAHVSHIAARTWLNEARIRIAVDDARDAITEALTDAGAAGLPSPALTPLAHGQRTGPLLMGMMRSGLVKRLDNGNWALR